MKEKQEGFPNFGYRQYVQHVWLAVQYYFYNRVRYWYDPNKLHTPYWFFHVIGYKVIFVGKFKYNLLSIKNKFKLKLEFIFTCAPYIRTKVFFGPYLALPKKGLKRYSSFSNKNIYALVYLLNNFWLLAQPYYMASSTDMSHYIIRSFVK